MIFWNSTQRPIYESQPTRVCTCGLFTHTQPTQPPSTINCLRLMNVDAQEWACWSMALCIESWQPQEGWLRTGIFHDGEIELVVGEAGVRKHTDTFSARECLVCSITHERHSNICSDQLEDARSSDGQMITISHSYRLYIKVQTSQDVLNSIRYTPTTLVFKALMRLRNLVHRAWIEFSTLYNLYSIINITSLTKS